MSSVSSAELAFLKSLNNDNIENLSFYGSEAQSGLAAFSKNISGLIRNGEEDRFSDLAQKLEGLTSMKGSEPKEGGFLSKIFNKGGRSVSRNDLDYNEMMRAADDLKLCLQLQQARLIKDNFVLDEMGRMVEAAGEELGGLIEAGERWIEEHRGSGDDADLINRVEKRLDDLRISRMISLQSLEQTRLMKENNKALIDKSVSAVTNVIPLWQNRAAIMKSLDNMEGENRKLSEMLEDLSSTREADKVIKEKLNELIKPEV